MATVINKHLVTPTELRAETLKIRFCPICGNKPIMPMIYRGKNYDFCWPYCFRLALTAVIQNNHVILNAIDGQGNFEF